MGDTFAGLAVLLLVQLLFLAISYNATRKFGQKRSAANNQEFRSAIRIEHRKLLLIRQIPVLIFSLLCWYTLLPKTIQIIRTESFNAWKNDPVIFIVLLIELGLTAIVGIGIDFIVWSILRRCKRIGESSPNGKRKRSKL